MSTFLVKQCLKFSLEQYSVRKIKKIQIGKQEVKVSAIKNTCCSCRGQGLHSQLQHRDSELSLIPVLRERKSSLLASTGTKHVYRIYISVHVQKYTQ